MLDDWYRVIRLPLTFAQFQQLPRNSAYKYEYDHDHALLSPRARTCNALLTLSGNTESPTMASADLVTVRALQPADWLVLPDLFTASFGVMQPFASLDEHARRRCSEECLEQTRTGGDGPVIERACFVACRARAEIVGAILITLIPERAEGNWWNGRWDVEPPADAVALRLGRPHLTWVFVAPDTAGQGIGSALLAQSRAALADMGFADLASTFLVGNDVSMLWHWRNGFRLLAYPGSLRTIRDRNRTEAKD